MNSTRLAALSCVLFAVGFPCQAQDRTPPATEAEKVRILQEQKAAVTDIQSAAKSPSVATELAEPDGASVVPHPDGGWILFGRGTGVYDFNEADEIRQATQDAQLRAKAHIAKFLTERITSEEKMANYSAKLKKLSDNGDGKPTTEVSKRDLQIRVEKITNQAQAILKGLVVIETSKQPKGNGGTVEVTVGCSSKTIALAARISGELSGTTGTVVGSDGKPVGQGGAAGGANQPERRKSKTDL